MDLICVKITSSRAIFRVVYLVVALFALEGCGKDISSGEGQRARWHNNQGVVYMDQHHYARAKEEFERAIELDPVHANSHANLGIAYYSLGKYDSAGTALRTALRHDPGHLHSHYTLGLIYSAQGKQYELALKAFEQVAEADPDDPLVYYYLGQVKAKLGRSEEAIAALRQAIRLDPYNTSAYYALANQLRRLGRTEDWQAVLDTFDRLSRAGHEGISTSYQGQGKYAEAVTDAGYADSGADDTRGPFLFSSAAVMEGLPEKIRFSALVDFDGDGDPDLLLGDGKPLLYRNEGNGFTPIPEFELPLPEDARVSGAVFGDADNDGRSDLVLSGEPSLFLRGEGDGSWVIGDSLGAPARRMVFADTDHDGDLDLLALGQKGIRLFANDGSGTFSPVTSPAGITTEQPGQRAIFSDFDNDRDVDGLVLSAGSVQLFTNNRDGTYSEIGAELGLHSINAADVCVEDFDQDGYMDLGALTSGGQLVVYANQAGKGFISGSPLTIAQEQVQGLRPADLDNDGDLDLLVFGDRGIHLLAYHGDQFHLEKEVVGSGGANAGNVMVADFDGDGATDVWDQGILWRNDTEGGQWIKIVVQGLNSNRGGVGAKVEVKTTNRHQKRVVRGGSEDFGILNFGLAGEDSVEFVRVLWPSGVRQTELATPAAQRLTLTELNRKGTSCPILYVWDGEEFRFVTDILGGSIIGYLLAPGEYYKPDTDEYVRVGGMEPKDGNYIVQFANQLEEVIYLDALQLVAVDHPAEVEVYPNERLLSSPPYPDFHLYFLKDLQPPQGASDHLGRDIIASLQSIDDLWYEGFERERIHGYARDYTIELDLGNLGSWDHPVLLGYGWMDYAHSSSNWAAAQQGLELYPPRLEVADGKGDWTEVSADMGSPAGLPKHLLFDLKGLFPSADYRLRITTNTPIYWDQFQVGRAVDAALQVHRLHSDHSDLHWRGYPEHTSIKGTFAFRYHYDRLRLRADWGSHSGAFTRFGEVTELVGAVDDKFVIMFHGDELTATFDAGRLPPLKAGQQRTFMLYADGFGKDMDFHSAHSLTVAPLPFHAMSGYPYPATETYPLDQEHLDYLLEYNTRRIKGHYE